MFHNAKGQLVTKTLLLLISAWVFGWFFDASLVCFILALIALLTFHIYHLLQLVKWLSAPYKTLPPDSFGTWGQIYDHLSVKQLNHSKEIGRYKHIVKRVQASTEALADAVVIVNKDNQLLWWNKAAQSLLGLKRKVDVGQLITNLIREPKFRKFLMDPYFDSKLDIQTHYKQTRHIQVTKATYGDDERLLLLQDVTKLKVLEKTRRDFISNASHELRTPLTVLKGYLETFEDFSDQLPKAFLKPLKQMQSQSNRMENLVTDLLALSNLEEQSESDRSTQVDMKAIIEPILNEAKSLGAEKNQEIVFNQNSQLQLVIDSKQLSSAISNLVFNAVRYSPENTRIDITWSQDGKLSVADQGVGIESIHIPRLTERFYRVDDSRNSDSGGTGLGLAIVKHIMRNHQGELLIHSKYSKGSTFTLAFPEDRLVKVS